jgi:hypothetical protein
MTIDEAFDQITKHACEQHEALLLEHGATQAEVDASLDQYRILLNRWRAEAVARTGRFVDEPDAPTHELQ